MSEPALAEVELADLLARIAAGSEEALAALYRRLSRRIYAFALRRLSAPEAAEEVVVETLFEVWRHAARFDGRSQVASWILGIARHKALDKLRARGQREMVETDGALDEVADESPSAYERIAHRQQARQIADCLDTLPDVQRESLHLVFYEDMGIAEIAAIQGCPDNTVKTRLFHARRKMRDCLERQIDTEDRS